MKTKNTPLGWYCVSKDGQAMQCIDKKDAQQNATAQSATYPLLGPYRAVQLCEYHPTKEHKYA